MPPQLSQCAAVARLQPSNLAPARAAWDGPCHLPPQTVACQAGVGCARPGGERGPHQHPVGHSPLGLLWGAPLRAMARSASRPGRVSRLHTEAIGRDPALDRRARLGWTAIHRPSAEGRGRLGAHGRYDLQRRAVRLGQRPTGGITPQAESGSGVYGLDHRGGRTVAPVGEATRPRSQGTVPQACARPPSGHAPMAVAVRRLTSTVIVPEAARRG